MGEVKVQPKIKKVTTMIKQILGEQIEHEEYPVNSMAVIETAAEKWVGLTRRVATSKYIDHYKDPNLVRHLYDLHKINEMNYINEQFAVLLPKIVLADGRHYKNHNHSYFENPIGEIKRAVDELVVSKEWHDNWDRFVEVMVYSKNKPTYQDVLSSFLQITEKGLRSLLSQQQQPALV